MLIDCIDSRLSLKITSIITRIIAVRFNGDGFSARLESLKKRVKYSIPTETESLARERGRVHLRTNNYLICTRIASYCNLARALFACKVSAQEVI